MYWKWKPSKKAKREFAEKMQEIDEFCSDNCIIQSASSDSYYFDIDDQKYRVSNHTVENSNRHAYKGGEQIRREYHPDGERPDTIYITASKTRIIEIYTALKSGKKLTRRGYVKED